MNFKDDDKLNREHFAEFLIEIITNHKRYKRESDSNSFVLAIDSSWGTGKTTFLKMLENKMNETQNNIYTIINYNAWKSDAWKNPFETLMYTILENEIFNATDDINNLKEIGKDLKEVAKSVGKGFLKKQLSKIVSEEVINEIDEKLVKSGDCKRFIDNNSINYDFFAEYKEYQNSIKKMKENLKKVCTKTKLVIFIDELDRCRPTFSIELLEMIKHLFDVENMVFIFALDISQLSYSVQSVYGTGIDSAGYLCRFFDYISKLPKFDVNTYINSIIQKTKLINFDLKKEINKQNFFTQITFDSTFKDLANLYNLSLRDINTIYSSFLLFEKMELSEVRNLQMYQWYLLLMIMKYKDSKCFHKMFIEKDDLYDEIFIKQISKLDRKEYNYTSIISFINKDYRLKNIDSGNGYTIDSVDTVNKKIKYSKNDGFHFTNETLKKDQIYNDILSYNDLTKWEQIKDLYTKDFIHRKLEMFDFSWKEE